ncbi:MAG: shikimate kinase [Candidatus Omnitrophota bacterium]|nr:shikimate kinase [Candidatus Omnitrophota bacterium]
MNIVLVGFMGTGKTVVARALARKLGRKYLDLDDEIERQTGRSINEIFKQDSEQHFRRLEKITAKKVSRLDDQVLATGGGVVLDKQNIDNLKKNGVLVCLSSRPEIIYSRVKGRIHRPLLNVDDPLTKIKDLLSARKPYYAKADFAIDTSELTVEEVVNKIVKLLN